MTSALKYRIGFTSEKTELAAITKLVPELAAAIGLNESILLMQIDFWIGIADHKNYHDGKWWTYQSLEQMRSKAFPYWSRPTISRVVKSLEKKGLIFVGNYNKFDYDKTQWFALNHEAIASIIEKHNIKCLHLTSSLCLINKVFQNETGVSQNETTPLQNETTIPESTPESTPEERENSAHAKDASEETPTKTDTQNLRVLPNIADYPIQRWVDRQYADGKPIERLIGGVFHHECIAIFEAWREGMAKHGVASKRKVSSIWGENLRFVMDLAIARTKPEDVKAYVLSRYEDGDQWHKVEGRAVSLKTLADEIDGWLAKQAAPAAPAHPSHRPAQLDTQQEQAPEVVAANLAMLDDLDAVEPSMEESA